MARVPDGFQIDPETYELVPIKSRSTTKTRFMKRISIAEFSALNLMSIDPAVPLDIRAAIMTLTQLRDMSDEIGLDDPDTQYGVAVSINLLTTLPAGSMGHIPVAQATTRVDAWLADYPQPGEVYP